MRVYLSGMPELRLGLNDKVLFESTGSMYLVFTVGRMQKHTYIDINQNVGLCFVTSRLNAQPIAA